MQNFRKQAAWGFGARAGAPPPQLPTPTKDMSEAPAGGVTPVGGTVTDTLQSGASMKLQANQQNLSEKTMPLKVPVPPAPMASATTVRNRNDRMARQVTQPPSKTVVASVHQQFVGLGGIVSLQKTAQMDAPPPPKPASDLIFPGASNPVTQWINRRGLDASYALKGMKQDLRGTVTGDALAGARDAVSGAANRAMGAVGTAMNYRLPGINATPAQALGAVGEGLMGVPVVGPMGGQVLRAVGRWGQGAARAGTQAATGLVRSGAGKAVGMMDDAVAGASRAMGMEPAYAGGYRPPVQRVARPTPAAGTKPLRRDGGMYDFDGMDSAPAAPTPPTPAPAQGFGPSQPKVRAPQSTGTVAETAETAVQKAPTPTPNNPIPSDDKALRRLLVRADPQGRGVGVDMKVPEMQQLLRDQGYATMSKEQLSRMGGGVRGMYRRFLNQQPHSIPEDLPSGGFLRRQSFLLARDMPIIGRHLGGSGLRVDPVTGQPGGLGTAMGHLARGGAWLGAGAYAAKPFAPEWVQNYPGAVMDWAGSKLTDQPVSSRTTGTLQGKTLAEMAAEGRRRNPIKNSIFRSARPFSPQQ